MNTCMTITTTHPRTSNVSDFRVDGKEENVDTDTNLRRGRGPARVTPHLRDDDADLAKHHQPAPRPHSAHGASVSEWPIMTTSATTKRAWLITAALTEPCCVVAYATCECNDKPMGSRRGSTCRARGVTNEENRTIMPRHHNVANLSSVLDDCARH